MSDKKFLPALLLAIFLGALGAHRFYVGKTGTAVLQLLTCGGLGVWALVDIVMIAMGTFRDKNGLQLARN
jgi:TM2 domain-containing membrane protein YozV